MRESESIEISTSRFANVAFSDGSLYMDLINVLLRQYISTK